MNNGNNGFLIKLKDVFKCSQTVEKQEYSIDEFILNAYLKAWQIMREKRNQLLTRINMEEGVFLDNISPYNIPDYMGNICNMMGSLISDISKVNRELISVTFFYQFANCMDKKWHWVTDREDMKTPDVSEFISQKKSIFNQLINGELTYLYVADKKKNMKDGKYYPDRQDEACDYIGSTLCIKVDFEDNGKKYVKGVLLLSTYSQTFYEVDNYCKTVGKSFEKELVHSILPYYRQLLQTESGLLYVSEGINKQHNGTDSGEEVM